MESKLPFISVIIPVYNGATYLAEALDCVLGQQYRLLEIIIIDDGSTDKTAEVADRFRGQLKYIYQENQGPAAARNHGLRVAGGELIAFLDADDLWPDQTIQMMLEGLNKWPELEIILGLVQFMQTSAVNGQADRCFEKMGEPHLGYNLGCALYRRSVFGRVGLFDETMRFSEDVDWFMRAREQGIAMALLERVSLLYRRNQNSVTLGKDHHDLNFIKAFKRSLDRRRQFSPGLAQVMKMIPVIR